MLKIEMETSTRNFLVRLLENYKQSLKYTEPNKKHLEYILTQIAVANARLMGQAPKVSLSKNSEPINFGLTDDE